MESSLRSMKRRRFFRTTPGLVNLEDVIISSGETRLDNLSINNLSYRGMSVSSSDSGFGTLRPGTRSNLFLESPEFRVSVDCEIRFSSERYMGIRFRKVRGDVWSFYRFLDLPLLRDMGRVNKEKREKRGPLFGPGSYSFYPSVGVALLFVLFLVAFHVGF